MKKFTNKGSSKNQKYGFQQKPLKPFRLEKKNKIFSAAIEKQHKPAKERPAKQQMKKALVTSKKKNLKTAFRIKLGSFA